MWFDLQTDFLRTDYHPVKQEPLFPMLTVNTAATLSVGLPISSSLSLPCMFRLLESLFFDLHWNTWLCEDLHCRQSNIKFCEVNCANCPSYWYLISDHSTSSPSRKTDWLRTHQKVALIFLAHLEPDRFSIRLSMYYPSTFIQPRDRLPTSGATLQPWSVLEYAWSAYRWSSAHS